MRIILHGQQAFGQSVLEALLDRGEEIVGVYSAPDAGRPDPLKVAAEERGLPVFQPSSYKDPEVWAQMKSLEADLCVMAFVTLFVPEEALYAPNQDTIQYHPSLLPLHRGPSSINWPIIMGREKTGLSIFWPDNGLDEGPILMQKECAIGENDTLGSIYFDQLFPMGVDALVESVDLVRDGKAPRVDQDHSKKTYESWCRKDDVRLDWSKPVAEVHNMIRGADPVPGAWGLLSDKEVQLYGSEKVDGPSGAPGEITNISSEGMVIACGEGQLRVTRVRADGEKIAAGEFAEKNDLSAGAVLT
jgi:methionyl-tRNA formyltransferase